MTIIPDMQIYLRELFIVSQTTSNIYIYIYIYIYIEREREREYIYIYRIE